MEFVIIAVLGVALVAACPAFFIAGRKAGTRAELERQAAAKATAEESSRRIIGEAGVNIAGMQVARVAPGGTALVALSVDSALPDGVVDEVGRGIDAVSVRAVDLT